MIFMKRRNETRVKMMEYDVGRFTLRMAFKAKHLPLLEERLRTEK